MHAVLVATVVVFAVAASMVQAQDPASERALAAIMGVR